MAKTPARIVIEKKVWIVESNRKDNGNHLYYHVWAATADEAKSYLKRHDLAGIEVTFTDCKILTNGVYEDTVNCRKNDPQRYAAHNRLFNF